MARKRASGKAQPHRFLARHGSLNEALDLTTPAGWAMTALLAVFATSEREILQEMVLAGLAYAPPNGKRLDRAATAAHADKVRKLHRAGISKSEIVRICRTCTAIGERL
jgi:DNA invertase Pin-like site-specific DNA recombinase